jgi:hypothetical protein
LKELPMPDLNQIKQGEQGARDRRGRFSQGQIGFIALKARFSAFEQRFPIQEDPMSRMLAILVRLAERQGVESRPQSGAP